VGEVGYDDTVENSAGSGKLINSSWDMKTGLQVKGEDGGVTPDARGISTDPS